MRPMVQFFSRLQRFGPAVWFGQRMATALTYGPFPDYVLREIRQFAGNMHCCDCSALDTDWASVNYGTLICLECAGKHRSLGVHVSFVRSLHMDSWNRQEIEMMRQGGNGQLRDFFKKLQIEKSPINILYSTKGASHYRDRLKEKVLEVLAASNELPQYHAPGVGMSNVISANGMGDLIANLRISTDKIRPLIAVHVDSKEVYFGTGQMGFTLTQDTKGAALVSRLVSGGAAEQKGVQVGEYVVGVMGKMMYDYSEIMHMIQHLPRPLKLTFQKLKQTPRKTQSSSCLTTSSLSPGERQGHGHGHGQGHESELHGHGHGASSSSLLTTTSLVSPVDTPIKSPLHTTGHASSELCEHVVSDDAGGGTDASIVMALVTPRKLRRSSKTVNKPSRNSKSSESQTSPDSSNHNQVASDQSFQAALHVFASVSQPPTEPALSHTESRTFSDDSVGANTAAYIAEIAKTIADNAMKSTLPEINIDNTINNNNNGNLNNDDNSNENNNENRITEDHEDDEEDEDECEYEDDDEDETDDYLEEPVSIFLELGTIIKVFRSRKWRSAMIKREHRDGTYKVKYRDGSYEPHVSIERMAITQAALEGVNKSRFFTRKNDSDSSLEAVLQRSMGDCFDMSAAEHDYYKRHTVTPTLDRARSQLAHNQAKGDIHEHGGNDNDMDCVPRSVYTIESPSREEDSCASAVAKSTQAVHVTLPEDEDEFIVGGSESLDDWIEDNNSDFNMHDDSRMMDGDNDNESRSDSESDDHLESTNTESVKKKKCDVQEMDRMHPSSSEITASDMAAMHPSSTGLVVRFEDGKDFRVVFLQPPLGLTLTETAEGVAEVTRVLPGGQASGLGVIVGDMLVGVEKQWVRGYKEVMQLLPLQAYPVALVFRRGAAHLLVRAGETLLRDSKGIASRVLEQLGLPRSQSILRTPTNKKSMHTGRHSTGSYAGAGDDDHHHYIHHLHPHNHLSHSAHHSRHHSQHLKQGHGQGHGHRHSHSVWSATPDPESEIDVIFVEGEVGARMEESCPADGEGPQAVACCRTSITSITLGGQADMQSLRVGYAVLGINQEYYISHAHTIATLQHARRPISVRFLKC